jgi:hypothetical protein
VNGPRRLQRLPEAVWINPPEKKVRQDALGSTQTDRDDPEVVSAINTYGLLTRPGARQALGASEQAAH